MAEKKCHNLWLVGCIALLASLYACQVNSLNSPKIYKLQKGDLKLKLTNWGATILSVQVPDAKGKLGDIVLGFDSLKPYMNGSSSYFGAVVGRVANRIKGAQFTLDGRVYHLPANDGNNTLHGGKRGFDKVLWKVSKIETGDWPSIEFTYDSYDGEQGFPGDLDVSATYTITGDKELTLVMKARPRNRATPVALVQHTYWNLAGHNSGRTILSNKVKIWAPSYTPVDQHLIPTGAIDPVRGTPYDFNRETTIGSRINKLSGGYDINMVLAPLKKSPGLRHAVRVKDDFSGRILNLWTTAPGLQFYTSNLLNRTVGKGGAIYGKYSGLCLETQTFPDAVHHPNFPNVIYRPGKVYSHTMVYRFSVAK